MKLKGKVSIVTGSTGDIGKKICEDFIKEGAIVIGFGRNEEKLEDLLNRLGKSFEPFKVDITDGKKVKEVISEIIKKHERIDVLVNCAGVNKDNLFLIMSEREFQEVLSVNLTGTFLVTKEVAKIMRKQKEGVIINITSIVGIDGNPGQVNYSASKAGLIGMTKTLAKELTLKGEKIRVNAVAPGFIDSQMTKKISQRMREEVLKRLYIKRLGKPEDVSKLVVFLASDDSEYITGQVIRVDGGLKL